MLEHTSVAEPDMAVAQVCPEGVEEKISGVHGADRQDLYLAHQQEQHERLHRADDHGIDERPQDEEYWVVPVRRQRRHDFGGMMQRVEWPENGRFVMQAMCPIFAE